MGFPEPFPERHFPERDSIRLLAPAKTNLFLAIGKRQADGYHEVATVMHALDLHDVLYMESYVLPSPQSRCGLQTPYGSPVPCGSPALEGPLVPLCPLDQEGFAAPSGSQTPEGFAAPSGSSLQEAPPFLTGPFLPQGVSFIEGAQTPLGNMPIEGANPKGISFTEGAQSSGGLRIELTESACEGLAPLGISAEENLAVKAVRALARSIGHNRHELVHIHLEKHIPSQAGLGGGSSDAAAALMGAARLWGIAPDSPMLKAVAEKLGSDVAFFLSGGCAYMTGTGSTHDHSLGPLNSPVVIIKPEGGVPTAAAYAAFDRKPLAVPTHLVRKARTATHAQDVPLFNNLSLAAESILPELTTIRLWAQAALGVKGILLSGSGSATIAVCTDLTAAGSLSAAAQAKGWWATTTTFNSQGASLVFP
ncbi:MAG: hypothetical protein LBG81_02650 [Coriobacteriaceae bacterium]|nr:hypothetical protein [Coriobacteriaceae bacterium]